MVSLITASRSPKHRKKAVPQGMGQPRETINQPLDHQEKDPVPLELVTPHTQQEILAPQEEVIHPKEPVPTEELTLDNPKEPVPAEEPTTAEEKAAAEKAVDLTIADLKEPLPTEELTTAEEKAAEHNELVIIQQ